MTASRRNLQIVSKGTNSVSNRAVVRATICGVNQSVEKFVEDSELDGLERSDSVSSQNLVKPPFDPLVLAQLQENSSELGKCIEAMEVNIEGFGGRIQSVLPKQLSQTLLGAGSDADTEEQKALRAEYMSEWFRLDSLFNNPNPDDNLTTLRRKVRKDIESTGNGFWEIVKPDAASHEISCINYVAAHSIRLGKLDEKETIVAIKQLQPDFTYKNKVFKKRFRKFAQVVGINKLIWFKEWEDPRVMDKRSGKWLSGEDAAKLPKKYHATGLMWFRIHSSRTPYGVPRYIGNLFEVFGSRAASEINFITFKNNNIPSMAVLVSGGMLTDATINRIEEFVNHNIKKSQNRSSFLILEADPGDDGLGNTGQVKVEIKPLTSEQHSDELFQNYDKNNREKIRECFRLPAIYVGRGDVKDSPDSRKLADEQVFSPERDEMDRRINQLVMYMGVRYWRFKSNSPTVTDDASLTNVLANGERSGALSPNLAREILSSILNKELPLYEANDSFDPDIPMSISLMRLTSQLGGFPGGTNQTGRLAPNQGQVPRGADLNEDGQPGAVAKQRQMIAHVLREVGYDEATVKAVVGCCGGHQMTKGYRQPDESVKDCVDRKIPILISEGMSQDQAVAAAHSMCEETTKGGPGSGGARDGAGRPAGGGKPSYAGMGGRGGVSVSENGQVKISKPKTPDQAIEMLDEMGKILEKADKEFKADKKDIQAGLRLRHVLVQQSRAMGYAKRLIEKDATAELQEMIAEAEAQIEALTEMLDDAGIPESDMFVEKSDNAVDQLVELYNLLGKRAGELQA